MAVDAQTGVADSDVSLAATAESSSATVGRPSTVDGRTLDLREGAAIDLRDQGGPTETSPAIAVVIPTFNRPDTLARLLDALERCSPVRGGVEVVVVDDGSTVEVGPVVARHPSVRLLQQTNAGPAAARNRGWRTTTAAIVAFTDDDTVPEPDWLVDLVRAFDDAPATGAIGGRIVALAPGRLAGFVQAEALVGHSVRDDGVHHLVTANAAYRRTVLEQLGGFDERFRRASGEDTDLTLRAVAAGHRLEVIDGAVVAHDNRTTFVELLAMYRKHGRTRHQVAAGNPDVDWDSRRARVLRPGDWRDRYRSHRASGIAPAVAAAYLLLRAVGLLAYGVGLTESAWERRGPGRPRRPARGGPDGRAALDRDRPRPGAARHRLRSVAPSEDPQVVRATLDP